MHLAAELGLVNQSFIQALEQQVGDEVIFQTLIEYIKKRPELWITFAIIYAKTMKGEFKCHVSYLDYLRQEFDILIQQYTLQDVTSIEHALGI